jgi:hypothetical protein
LRAKSCNFGASNYQSVTDKYAIVARDDPRSACGPQLLKIRFDWITAKKDSTISDSHKEFVGAIAIPARNA